MNARLDLTEKGRIANEAYSQDDPDNPELACMTKPTPGGIVYSRLYPLQIEIDEEDDVIFIRSQFFDQERTVYMDGRAHPPATERTHEGHSIGRWEGNVLIVDTTNFADNRSPYQNGIPSGAQKHVVERYWLKQAGYLSDCLHLHSGQPAHQAEPDDALRPNQLLAITLGALTDRNMGRHILAACEELLVPGAIRSLADRPVRRPLPIMHGGKMLNDPTHPYRGRYTGHEDTSRKPAYHNGTAWTWLFPAYCEAWAEIYGKPGQKTALAWLGSSATLLRSGCVGHLPEILDGDYPHTARGCDAQAWGCSEWVRVWLKLSSA